MCIYGDMSIFFLFMSCAEFVEPVMILFIYFIPIFIYLFLDSSNSIFPVKKLRKVSKSYIEILRNVPYWCK